MAPTPRSPYDQVAGLFHFARMLDKIRLADRGELPSGYAPLLGEGFDGRLCRYLGVPYSQVRSWTLELEDDAAVARRCFEAGRALTDEDKLIWNSFVSKRGWRDDETADYIPQAAHAYDDDGSVQTDFDLLQLDEGKPLDAWTAAWHIDQAHASGPLPGRVQDLARIVRRHAKPLAPIPTETEPKLVPISGIRSVVFDIYGTLLISASGDISLAEERRAASEQALRETLLAARVPLHDPAADLHDRFLEKIHSARRTRMAEGTQYPEVEIRDVWRQFLREVAAKGRTADFETAVIERIATDYEARVNPVWSMPHVAETLAWLRGEGLVLGIVSNAQFYTRTLFPALLGQPLRQLGFALDCCIFSYRKGIGKPAVDLYRDLAGSLQQRGIRPAETLYVGNDMRNDIRPAATLGFRTALFAGDQRSLRWRHDDPDAGAILPDAVITDLFQLVGIVQATL